MKVFYGSESYDLGASVVALGTFDGLHAGHRALIARAKAIAQAEGLTSVLCTFDKHPMEVLCPERCPKLLMTLEEKLAALEKCGVDAVLVQPFTAESASTDPLEYLRDLVRALQVKCIVAGFNYTFGDGGRGDAAMLRREAPVLGYRAEIVEAVRDGEDVVSSTLIRRLIAEGETGRAERLKAGKVR